MFANFNDKHYIQDVEKELARINGVDEIEMQQEFELLELDLNDASKLETQCAALFE